MILETGEEIAGEIKKNLCVGHLVSKGTNPCGQIAGKAEAENSELPRKSQQVLWGPWEYEI